MKNQEIADIFNRIADLLEIKGENPFRIRAYRRASQNLESLTINIENLSHEDLLNISGIGQDLAGKIEEYIKTGRVSTHEELIAEIPEGLLDLIAVPGLGPKTSRLLYEKLKIKNLDDLEKMAIGHKLSELPGIREKTEENILKGISMLKRGRERKPIGRVLPIALDIVENLKNNASVFRIDLAGSLRRWKDTIKDIDILAASEQPNEVMREFDSLPQIKEVLMRGPTKSSIVIKENLQVDLRVVKKESYGAALAYFTGSKEHNIRLRELAVKKGLKINEYGIFRESDDKRLGGEDEGDIYKILGMPYIPPELREDNGEIEAALAGKLPELIALNDIKGDLHVHSRWSDGSHSFEDLADAAKKYGYSYIAITDHSKGLGIAGGLNEEQLLEQGKEIKAINKRLRGFRIIHGVEVDIRSDGTLDISNDVLKELDVVVASIHSGFKQSRQQLTKRIVSAMKNPYVSIIAHPTGRLIGERDAYDVDMDEILTIAKKTGTAIEINAYPLRLDINDTYAKRAKEMGIPIVIATDTHVTNQFDYMRYGVSIARRGWLEKDDVLNTLAVDKLLKQLKPVKGKKP